MNKLKELRTNKGLTQKELAKIIGCNQTAIGKYERGDLEPNITILKELSKVFGVSVDYLIGNADDFGNIVIAPSKESFSTDEKEILDNFDKLGPFEREAIMIQIKALAEKCGATEK